MSHARVLRLFVPLGWRVPLPALSSNTQSELLVEAHCRHHRQGVDIYLCTNLQHESIPAPLLAGESRLCVLWLPGLPDGAGNGGATSPQPLLRLRKAEDSQVQLSNTHNSTRVTFFGMQTCVKSGRCTLVPKSAMVEPWSGGALQLQVFTYDQRSWWQVAQTEADSRVPYLDAGPSSDLLPDPLPLRLALRPCGNPELRGPAWTARLSTTPPPAAMHVALGKAGRCRRSAGLEEDVATAAGGNGANGAAEQPPSLLAMAGGVLSLASRVLQGKVLPRAAECIVQHSATVRHVQHIVACVGAMYGMYGIQQVLSSAPVICHLIRSRKCSPKGSPADCDSAKRTPGELPGRSGKGSRAVRATTSAAPRRQHHNQHRQSRANHIKECEAAEAGSATTAQKGGSCRLSPGTTPGGGSFSGPEGSSNLRLPQPMVLRGKAATAASCLVLSLVLQLLVGPALAIAVWRWRKELVGAVAKVAAAAEHLLREQYDWLMTATPAGVKLHAELCALLGTAAHTLLSGTATAVRWVWPRCGSEMVGLLAAGSATGGLGGGLAVVHDLLLLASATLSLQMLLSDMLLRRHIAWLKTAWALLRGKQRNCRRRHHSPPPPPRGPTPSTAVAEESRASKLDASNQKFYATPFESQQRRQPQSSSDFAVPTPACGGPSAGHRDSLGDLLRLPSGLGAAGVCQEQGQGSLVPISRLENLLGLTPEPGSDEEVVVEQLIVGVLLLVPLLALLPTTAAWHLLALAAWGIPAAIRLGLALVAGALRDNVLLVLTWRALRPLDFAGPEVMVHCINNETRAVNVTTASPAVGNSKMTQPEVHNLFGANGTIFFVEPLPISWGSLTATWMVRGMQGGWGLARFDHGEERFESVTKAKTRVSVALKL